METIGAITLGVLASVGIAAIMVLAVIGLYSLSRLADRGQTSIEDDRYRAKYGKGLGE